MPRFRTADPDFSTKAFSALYHEIIHYESSLPLMRSVFSNRDSRDIRRVTFKCYLLVSIRFQQFFHCWPLIIPDFHDQVTIRF